MLLCRAEAFWKYLKDGKHSSRFPEANVAAAATWGTAVACVTRCSPALQAALRHAAGASEAGGLFVAGLRLSMPSKRRSGDASVVLSTTPTSKGFMCEKEVLQRAVWRAHPDLADVFAAWEASVAAENAARAATAAALGKRRPTDITYNNPLAAAAEWALERSAAADDDELRTILKDILEITTVQRYNCCWVGQRYIRGKAYEAEMATMNSGVYKKVCADRKI